MICSLRLKKDVLFLKMLHCFGFCSFSFKNVPHPNCSLTSIVDKTYHGLVAGPFSVTGASERWHHSHNNRKWPKQPQSHFHRAIPHKASIFCCFDVFSVRPPQIFQVQAEISTKRPVFLEYLSVCLWLYSNGLLCIKRSNISHKCSFYIIWSFFLQMVSKETVWQFFKICLSRFLWIGITFAFSLRRKLSLFHTRLKDWIKRLTNRFTA